MMALPTDVLQRLRARHATMQQYRLLLSDLDRGMRAELTALGIDPDRVVLDLDRGFVEETPDGPAVEPAQ